jgi:diaminohydroxyphosphoribosylaminopyrimidine deaminase/5-amino-6-(5-phosphoribosylamino)uracil reductase
MSALDTSFMEQALELARAGLGRVAPNPSVGCVIVKDGVVVGVGRTQDGGRPHAEDVALEQAGDRANGADIYVTLEPCFKDASSSCSLKIIEAKPARVIVGCRDKNPAIEGRGICALKQAGIEVVEGLMEKECADLNQGFFLSKNEGRPFVTLKIATSLDSKIATFSGQSKWITGEGARACVHATRARQDAVLTGIGTILSDDPQLTARISGIEHKALKVILDTTFRIPEKSNVLAGCDQNDAIVFVSYDHTDNSLQNAQVVGADLDPEGKISIPFVLKYLADRGITRVMVEAGAGVFTSFMRSGLWDELHLYRAPIIIGGDGKDAFGAMGLSALGDAPRLVMKSHENLGEDILEIYAQS